MRAITTDVPRGAVFRYSPMFIGFNISPGLVQMLAPGQFSFIAPGFPIATMRTIEEIRHDNLLLILAELAAVYGERGAIQRLANGMSRSHSQVSQLKTQAKHSKTGKPRNIGPATARLIEQAGNKARGWLDVPRDMDDLTARLTRLVDDAVAKRLTLLPPAADTIDGPVAGVKSVDDAVKKSREKKNRASDQH